MMYVPSPPWSPADSLILPTPGPRHGQVVAALLAENVSFVDGDGHAAAGPGAASAAGEVKQEKAEHDLATVLLPHACDQCNPCSSS